MLLQSQRDQNSHQCAAKAQNSVPELARPLSKGDGQPTEHQDHGELRHLRRLELNPRNGNPAFGTIDALPCNKYQQKQHNGGDVNMDRKPVPDRCVNPAEQPHTAQPQQGTDGLFGKISDGCGISGVIL